MKLTEINHASQNNCFKPSVPQKATLDRFILLRASLFMYSQELENNIFFSMKAEGNEGNKLCGAYPSCKNPPAVAFLTNKDACIVDC